MATPLVAGLIAFGASQGWAAFHRPAPTGTIRKTTTEDAYVDRATFYRRYVHGPPPTSQASGAGAVFLVQTDVHHASTCAFTYTARNLTTDGTVGDLVDRRIDDVAGGTSCGGEKRIWVRWPCVPADTKVQFQIDLVAGSRTLDSKPTKAFLIGGGC